jgi:hypothetical protein
VVVVKNEVFWYGIVPFEQRKRQIEQAFKQTNKKQDELTVGSLVCCKKQPVYRAGTRAVKLLDNQPKIGELMHDANKYDDISLEFKILTLDELFGTDSPEPSETEKEIADDMKPANRKRRYEEIETAKLETEKWNLKQIVFLQEEGKSKESVGKIVKIDGSICAVSFNGADNIEGKIHHLTKNDPHFRYKKR